MPPPLPSLSESPKHHPDCCLGLTSKLIDTIIIQIATLSSNSTRSLPVLSVGSGTGLLEAFLLCALEAIFPPIEPSFVEGVEVKTPSDIVLNKYLPEECSFMVDSTRDLWPGAARAGAWLFVYPRSPELVRRYLEEYAAELKVLIWLGPMADYAEFEGCFRNIPGFGDGQVVKECGLAEYEMMVVMHSNRE